jgi:hypothetical protein
VRQAGERRQRRGHRVQEDVLERPVQRLGRGRRREPDALSRSPETSPGSPRPREEPPTHPPAGSTPRFSRPRLRYNARGVGPTARGRPREPDASPDRRRPRPGAGGLGRNRRPMHPPARSLGSLARGAGTTPEVSARSPEAAPESPMPRDELPSHPPAGSRPPLSGPRFR